ncbi:uncharacterized protein [Cicer arietinum]|uniref:Uncharacterized protein LOC113788021 n=1 Tax=Cicer arietinum TaxID=3827 RepID=A0A3Q7Y474_CICAR|nr:uncharacterized protein LOC113788021 [Cicer arietinum]
MGTTIRNKQSKLKHFVLRILNKAKKLYVKGLVDCGGRISYGHAGVHISVSHPPQETKSVVVNDGERQSLRELLRTNETRVVMRGGERVVVPIRINNEMSMQRRQRIGGYKYNRNKMSYHIEMRKMGRIDEDKPCYFEEDKNYHSNSKPNLLYLYPRTYRTSGTVVLNSHAQ